MNTPFVHFPSPPRFLRVLRGDILRRLLPFAAVVCALTLAGCARKAAEPTPRAVSYPYSASEARVFYATSSGLAETPAPVGRGAADANGADVPQARTASRAPNASVLSSDGKTAFAAINGWGIERVEPSSDGAAYRVAGQAMPEAFVGLSTGGAWPLDGGFLVQLYRDPFGSAADAVAPGKPRSHIVYWKADKTGLLNPFAAEGLNGYELFALLPEGRSWFAELRKEGADRVSLKFLALDSPLAAPAVALREVKRSEFEEALRPKPFSALPPERRTALKAALAALGEGPSLVRLRDETGEDLWLLSGGSADEARSLFAWARVDGSVLVLSRGGELASGREDGSNGLRRLMVPGQEASFVGLAAVGPLAVAAWEAGEFPTISAAGLLITPSAK